ncbi:MAG: hypothetical protein U0N08_01200 [Oscillospiraceae bacterium]
MLYELLRGEQELLSTLDPQLYVKVTGALQAANIRYRVKATSTGAVTTGIVCSARLAKIRCVRSNIRSSSRSGTTSLPATSSAMHDNTIL